MEKTPTEHETRETAPILAGSPGFIRRKHCPDVEVSAGKFENGRRAKNEVNFGVEGSATDSGHGMHGQRAGVMFKEMVGKSPGLLRVLAQTQRVAPLDTTVLITGETGTGKELLARSLHSCSRRASGRFVAVNCGAIPQSLIASELFGHEKGAFTGALQRRLGRFELAHGGTIFLDEIGELPPEMQVMLLRVLQERSFERVGGGENIHADVRVIAATHRDLPTAIASGKFRSDLFYRLSVFPIEIPALRNRQEDIPILARRFAERYSVLSGRILKEIDPRSIKLLQAYSWPGNIRELQNVIERAVIDCESEILTIQEHWLPSRPTLPETKTTMLTSALALQETEIIEQALRECRGRISGPAGAAARLGIPPSTLESKILTLRIDKHRFKSPLPLETDQTPALGS